MKRRLFGGGATLAAIGSLVQVAAGASAPHLGLLASKMSGQRVTVTCDAKQDEGSEASFVAGDRWRIKLWPDACRALRLAPRVIEPKYPLVSSGEAVFTLAHEIGHVVDGPDRNHLGKNPEMAESHADCYAASHWRGLAVRLGFKRSQFPELARQIAPEGCWH